MYVDGGIHLKKVIIFDLYDTVLKDITFDFEAGIMYLYNTFFKEKCSFEELKEYAETFLPLYDKRKVDYIEVCLIKDEVPLFFEKFNVAKPASYEELDYDIMNHMQKVTLLSEVRDTLEELQKQGIKMYILSNSIFTGNSAKRLLHDFGILHCFEKIFSSADYGIRKPSEKFYQIAISEILSEYHEVKKEDILYIGNDYETDAMGATSVGLDTVWYNVNHLPNRNGIDIWDIDDFKQILEIVRS